ncbi:hypothetical protein OIO90_006196 [Microbotryomycetes sp. JL221]|nr:hypothetical protein OIO90_006196 [Microbotryomycetes sp. JL221]
MPSTVTNSSHNLPQHVEQAIDKAKDVNQASDDVWTEATQLALDWLLSLEPVTTVRDANTSSTSTHKGKQPYEPPNNVVHWYCGAHGADQLWPATVLLTRLLSFKRQGPVADWKLYHDKLLHTCALCVEAFQHAKTELINDFLSLIKPQQAIEKFRQGIERIEIDMVRHAFDQAGLTAPSTSSTKLDSVPLAVVHNCLVNPLVFQQRDIVDAINNALPVANDTLPLPGSTTAGLLAWRLHKADKVRTWCHEQLSHCDKATSQQMQHNQLLQVMQAHLNELSNNDRGRPDSTTSDSSNALSIEYTQDKVAFWQGLADCLNALSTEAVQDHLVSSSSFRQSLNEKQTLDVVQLVVSHLSDTGDHLTQVLSCFNMLITQLGSQLWKRNADRYEEVVLHAILDNPKFEDLFTQQTIQEQQQDMFSWLEPLLDSVAQDQHLFQNSIAIIMSSLFDKLQHLRLSVEARTEAIKLGVKLLNNVFLSNLKPQSLSKTTTTDDVIVSATNQNVRFPHAEAIIKILDLYAGFLCRIAFHPQFGSLEWTNVRRLTRTFVRQMLQQDGRNITESVYNLGKFNAAVQQIKTKTGSTSSNTNDNLPTPPQPVKTWSSLWDKAYSTVQDTDLESITCLVIGASTSSHVELLTTRTWIIKNEARQQMKQINSGLQHIRDKLESLVIGLSDEVSSSLIQLMSNDDLFVESIIMLMLSPVESIQNMAQAIVKQTFDVVTRRECFRCMLFRFPQSTFNGLNKGIKHFLLSSRSLPENCGMAKRIVRCLSDVIDSLCASTDGLLRDQTFIMRFNQDSSTTFALQTIIMTLWKAMCRSLASLFKRTPLWASFFENEQMTEWMRDAILFGVDLVEQLRTFELAISGQSLTMNGNGNSQKSPLKSSSIVRQMLTVLNEPLEELTNWLRLNEQDLLSSSYDLLLSMLNRFNKCKMKLKPSTAARIERVVRTIDKPRDQRSNNLRNDQLVSLEKLLNVNTGQQRQQQQQQNTAVIEVSSDEDDLVTKEKFDKNRVKPVVVKSSTTATSSSKGPNFAVPTMKNVKTRPRGVPWTTYSSSKQNHSTDASSSSSSEEENEKHKLSGLASLANAQKPARIKQVEKRQVKMIDVNNNNNNSRTNNKGFGSKNKSTNEAAQAARIARLRGPVDLTRLHRTILQWDMTHEGDLPPSVKHDQNLRSVASIFNTPDEYFISFEPLLLTECWEQVKQSKLEADKEGGQVLSCQIAGRQSVDDFNDIFLTVEHGQTNERVWFSESDLVLLRQGSKMTLGKVQTSSFRRDLIEMTVRCHLGNDVTEVGSRLVGRTKWEILKLCSLSTVHREYAALQTVGDLELFEEIANPEPRPRLQIDPRAIDKTKTTYNVNDSQAIAINHALRTPGFSLIQGPPGTGKTKTILGLVGAFIDSRPRVAAPIVPGRPTDPSSIEPVAKVLLCAPSNAAVDEVAKRLKDGVRTSDGKHFVPKVVRIGADSAIDISVKDIFIDELVAREIGVEGTASNDSASKMQSLRAEVDTLRAERDTKIDEISQVGDNHTLRSELQVKLKELKAKIFNLSQQLDSEKDKAQQTKRAMDAQQRKVRMQILSNADVICSTLSGSGHDYMAQLPFDFETVIIDEAAQSVELSSLIPLKYGCRRCIMVGDPLQLPPTVVSGQAKRAGYERSLFVRLMELGRGSHLLNTQYRMHPNISAFPSAAFYDSRLQDGPDMDKITAQPWHANNLFPPYVFYHVSDGKEVVGRHHSLSNPREAATALALYERLLREYSDIDFDYRIGIVTPYKGQVLELKRAFRRRFGDSIISRISFNTVDGFQGQEKDIIILSCVRGGSADGGVGFLKDTRRMNVALTRARSSLFVLGDGQKLRQNKFWSNLVVDAESRGLFSTVDVNTFASVSTAKPPTVKATVSKSKVKPVDVAPTYKMALEISEKAALARSNGVKREAPDSFTKVDAKRRSLPLSSPANGSSSNEVEMDEVKPQVKIEISEAVVPAESVKPVEKRPVAAMARPKPKPSMFMPTKKRPAPGPNSNGSMPTKRPPA